MPQEGFGYQRFKQKLQELKTGSSSNKPFIWDMTLEQTYDARRKYLSWVEKNPTHEEIPIKKHLYEAYLIPRIQELELQQNIGTLPEFKKDEPKGKRVDALGRELEE